MNTVENHCVSSSRTIEAEIKPRVMSTLQLFKSSTFSVTNASQVPASEIKSLCDSGCPKNCCTSNHCKEHYSTNGVKMNPDSLYSITYGGLDSSSQTITSINIENCLEFSATNCLNASSNRIYMTDIENSLSYHIEPDLEGGLTSHPRLFGHSSVLYSDSNSMYLFIFGGRSPDLAISDLTVSSTLYRLEVPYKPIGTGTVFGNGLKKMEPTGDIPEGRFLHSMVLKGDTIFLFGGITYLSNEKKLLNSLFTYDIPSNVWTEIKA